MKKVLLVLGGLVALAALLVAVVLVVGFLQPVEHVASSRVALARTPDEVFARVADFATWPTWNGAMNEVAREPDADGKPRWRFEGKYGSMPMIVEASEPPLRLVTRIPADANLGFSGTWTYALAPGAEGGTTVTVTENGRVESALFRGVGALFLGPHDSLNAFLSDLGKSFGQDVEPEEVDA